LIPPKTRRAIRRRRQSHEWRHKISNSDTPSRAPTSRADWVADKKRRAEKIRNAKAELEAEAEAKLKAEAEAAEKREAEGRRKPGPKAAPPSTEPDAKAQKNFTDPDSRIMHRHRGRG
jgi:membrane protein involved in colicin uptake